MEQILIFTKVLWQWKLAGQGASGRELTFKNHKKKTVQGTQ